jgi:hypothetical protein
VGGGVGLIDEKKTEGIKSDDTIPLITNLVFYDICPVS